MSQFLKINLPIYLSIICQKILLVLFFWRLIQHPRGFLFFVFFEQFILLWLPTLCLYGYLKNVLCLIFIWFQTTPCTETTHIVHFEIFISQCIYWYYKHIRLNLHPSLMLSKCLFVQPKKYIRLHLSSYKISDYSLTVICLIWSLLRGQFLLEVSWD